MVNSSEIAEQINNNSLYNVLCKTKACLFSDKVTDIDLSF